MEEQFTSYDFKKTQRRSYYPHNQQIMTTMTATSSTGLVPSRPATPADSVGTSAPRVTDDYAPPVPVSRISREREKEVYWGKFFDLLVIIVSNNRSLQCGTRLSLPFSLCNRNIWTDMLPWSLSYVTSNSKRCWSSPLRSLRIFVFLSYHPSFPCRSLLRNWSSAQPSLSKEPRYPRDGGAWFSIRLIR